jgi:hypothetical protein
MTHSTMNQETQLILDRLPENATWEDLQYQIYLRQAVESGLKDSREGRTVPSDEARRRFGLEPK